MALMASTSVAGVSVLTGFNPCDVLVHSGAAAETAAPPCRARRGDDDAFELGGECATPLLVGVGRLSAPRHGFPRRLEGGQRAALASPRRDQGWTGSHPPTGWTVFHLPSTLGGCEPFDSQPMAEIKRGRPRANGTLTGPSAQTPVVVLAAASPASPPTPASSDPALD